MKRQIINELNLIYANDCTIQFAHIFN